MREDNVKFKNYEQNLNSAKRGKKPNNNTYTDGVNITNK